MSNFEATFGLRAALLALVCMQGLTIGTAHAQVVDVYGDDEDDEAASPDPSPTPDPSPAPAPTPAPQTRPDATTNAPTNPDASDIDRARAHLARGREHYAAGEYVKAAEEFERAFGARPVPAFQFNAGVAYERDGNFPRAIAHFDRYLNLAPDAKDAAAVRERLERLKKGVALAQAARPEDTKMALWVTPDPFDATVRISFGGQVLVETRGEVEYVPDKPGEYLLEADFGNDEKVSYVASIDLHRPFVFVASKSKGFTGELDLISEPSEASVYLDDKTLGVIGKTRLLKSLSKGNYHLWLEKPGFETEELDVEIVPGETLQRHVHLKRVQYGKVRVVSNVRGSEVFVDGNKVGVVEKAAVLAEVPAGHHVVSVSAPDMKTYEVAVEIHRGKETPVRVKLLPAVDRSSAWVTGGLAVLLIGGGIAAGLVGNGIKSDLEDERDAGVLRQDDSRIDLGFWLHAGADIAFGLGAVLGAFSVYYFLSDPLPDSEGEVLLPRDWTLNPRFGPGFAGASLGGSF